MGLCPRSSSSMANVKVISLLLLCAPLFASAASSGERCGTRAFGPDPDIVCDEGLSCQQWQGLGWARCPLLPWTLHWGRGRNIKGRSPNWCLLRGTREGKEETCRQILNFDK